MSDSAEFKYLGDFSATPPWHSSMMYCYDCEVRWVGCWDNFQCPKCGEGELPNQEVLETKTRQRYNFKEKR